MRISGNPRKLTVLALALIALAAPAATAGISNIVYSVTATNSGGTATFTGTISKGVWHADPIPLGEPYVPLYSWWQWTPVELRDPSSGNLIATLKRGSLDIAYDPQITMGFAVQAGEFGPTDFTITSALLTFPTLYNPTGQASAQFQITDTMGDFATLDPIGPGAYLTKYNGFVPAGTTFCEVITHFEADEFSSADQNANVGPVGIPGGIGSMSAQIKFTLSANDLASGTTNYEIVPEPASVFLLAVSFLFVRRR